MLPSPQIKLILVLIIICAEAKKPPGYMEPPKVPDPNPPKYEYGYAIADGKGDGQGKQEQRDGIYALGRYYVRGKDSSHNVQYFADDWGYHPVVEYSSVGPHSKVTSHFALGHEAVQQLKNKENNLPQLQGILENPNKLAPSPPPQRTSSEEQQQKDLGQTQQILLQPQENNQGSASPEPFTTLIPNTQTQDNQPQILQIPLLQPGTLGTEPAQHTDKLVVSQQQDETQNQQQTGLINQFLVFPIEKQTEESQLQQQDIQNLVQGQNQEAQITEDQSQHSQYVQQGQVYIQQPQVQQQVSIQELQLQPQQVVLRHEDPPQKVIFPQEQQIVYENQDSQDGNQKQHPKDNIISNNEQQGDNQQKQQLLIQTSIVHNQPEEERRYETAALFESTDSKLISTQQASQANQAGTQYDEAALFRENDGNFGSKLGSLQSIVDTTNKLIEHTKNLVTGEDVLNINGAILKENERVVSETPSTVRIQYTNYQQTSSGTTNTFGHSQDSLHSTTPFPVSAPSFSDQPIVVADFEENVSQSTTERVSQQEYYSTTSVTEEHLASNSIDITEPSTILVTPRPISSNFLAPITAGIQLQNIEAQAEEREHSDGQNYNVEIQKSVPYYLGKFEYPSIFEHSTNVTSIEKGSAEEKATENIELGKTLLFFPGQTSKVQIRLPSVEIKKHPTPTNNYITLQKLPSTLIKDNFLEIDQQQAQGVQHQVAVQHTDQQQAQGYQYQVGLQQFSLAQTVTQKPIEITKVIHKPYPVKVPYEVPYPVIKQVQVPVTVQKIIEKPIHITKYVEKPVPIPQPYPVEKIVDRPVHIPVQVTKYIDRPYPVEVRVPYPQPYPVEKVVQKIVKQPYPVEVRVPVPVDRIVERKVPVPHYIEKPVEKIVEKPVPHYVDRPVPVEVKVPVPQPYLVRVEVPKPYPVEVNKVNQNHYGLVQGAHVHSYLVPQRVGAFQTVQVSAPQQIYSQTGYSNNQQEPHAQQSQQVQTYFYANPYAYAPQINQYLPPQHEIILNNGYLPSKASTNGYLPPKKDCNLQTSETNSKNIYYTIRPQDYIGLLPPKQNNNPVNIVKKLRTARSNFDDKSVRMEYGFMPPLIPSLQIDEQGNPIEKGDK